MAIPREFIQDLLARINIVEFIDQRVPLKKSGKNYTACCPFHNEKSPSFTVNKDKQFYHCFGCGEHGNVIDFVMAFERLEFLDAMDELAHSLGLSVPKTKSQGHQKKPDQNLYQLAHQVSMHYQKQLRKHPQGQDAISYMKQRGLTGTVAKKYGLGLAIDAWDDVSRNFSSASKQLIEAGLLIEKEGQSRCYDRFRNRLMFPIRDRRGRTIGFGGRVFDDTKPKYLNSPETPIFYKSQELYGLYELKQSIKNIKQILIVEGYMDVVSLSCHGVDYAVASLGTSTTTEQIQLLFRQSQQVICCYDGDQAGRSAAWRTLETALPQLKAGQSLKFMLLPDGHDPDSYIRAYQKNTFEQQVHDAQSVGRFMFDTLQSKHQREDGSLAKQSMFYIHQVQDPILKETLCDQLARYLRLNNVDELKRKFNLSTTIKTASSQQTPQSRQTFTLRLAIALLLQHPELGHQLPEQKVLSHLKLPGIQLLIDILNFTRHQRLNTAVVLEHYREQPKYREALLKLSQWDTGLNAQNMEIEFKNSLIWFTNQYLEQRFNELNQKSNLTKSERYQLQDLLQILQS